MRPYTAARFEKHRTGITEQIQCQYDDLIDFRIGDPDLTTSTRIIEQAARDACNGYTHYMGSFGDPELINELVEFFESEYDQDYTPDHFMITASGSHAMWLAMQVTLNPGDEVIITNPCFDSYPLQIEDAGGKAVRLKQKPENGWQIVPEELEQLITPKTRGIVLNTPNNPCAVSCSDELLKAIADIAERHDLLVYADDIYTIFSYVRPFTPIAALPGMKERTITVRSFSKDYVMTGWRLGFIQAVPEVIQAAGALNGHIVYSAPSVSQRAAVAALRLRHELQPMIQQEFQKRAECALKQMAGFRTLTAEHWTAVSTCFRGSRKPDYLLKRSVRGCCSRHMWDSSPAMHLVHREKDISGLH